MVPPTIVATFREQLFASRAQAIRLDDVVVDAIVTAQACRHNQPHQLLVLRGNGAFQVCVMIDVVKALHQKVVGLLDIHVQPYARLQKPPRKLTFLRNLFLGELIGGFSAFARHGEKASRT